MTNNENMISLKVDMAHKSCMQRYNEQWNPLWVQQPIEYTNRNTSNTLNPLWLKLKDHEKYFHITRFSR